MSSKKGGEGLEHNEGADGGGSQEQPEAVPDSSSGGANRRDEDPIPTWALYRAEVQWRKAAHDAAAEYEDRTNAAWAAYRQAVAASVTEAYDRELAAITEASEGDQDGAVPGTASVDSLRRWQSSVDESRREAYRRAGAAQRKLAEDWEAPWLDLLEKQLDANLQYMRAVEEVHGAQQTRKRPDPFVVGDEGVMAMTPQAAFWGASAPYVVGDEGFMSTAPQGQPWATWAFPWAGNSGF